MCLTLLPPSNVTGFETHSREAAGRRKHVAGDAGWYFTGVTLAQVAASVLTHMGEQPHTLPHGLSDKWLGHVPRQRCSGRDPLDVISPSASLIGRSRDVYGGHKCHSDIWTQHPFT